MDATPRDRFLALVVSHVEGLAMEVWERDRAQRGWTPEQNEAVARYVSDFVQRVVLIDPSA
jgi:hypothetical protein